MKPKNIALVFTVILIVGAIWYLEKQKASISPATGTKQVVTLPTSTPESSGQVASNVVLQEIAASDKQNGYQPAIEIADPAGFINADRNFTISSLIGKKVILVDFWTYSCINCIRTLPYLTTWYQKYGGQGLEIVGIHTPEFEFEKNISNVQAAVEKYGIKYPVILDSNHGTWDVYGNLYWPHEYLIDIAGYIVHDHIGEGDYDQTEKTIQTLLQERAMIFGSVPMSSVAANTSPAPNLSGIQSPETYFGASRNEYLANGTQGTQGVQSLTLPASFSLNNLYLGGDWNFSSEYATNVSAGAKVVYRYDSSDVYFVASASSNVTVEVLRDGVPLSNNLAGSDVKDGKMIINQSRLYNVVNDPSGAGVHTIQLIIESPGLEAYTFTFG